jgi:hypothetical protein
MSARDRIIYEELTELQQRLLDMSMLDKPVLAYRVSALHGYGCTVLSDWLQTDLLWYRFPSTNSLKYLKRALLDTDYPGVVVDFECAVKPVIINNRLRAIESNPHTKPVLVMCHGLPPDWLDRAKWNMIDITNEPAPYDV